MDRVIELGILLDFYGAVLTEHQYSLVDAYANENLSLGEIAEREGISRQGVRDGIVRAERQLRDLEERLALIRRNEQLLSRLDMAENAISAMAENTHKEMALAAIRSAKDILEGNDGI